MASTYRCIDEAAELFEVLSPALEQPQIVTGEAEAKARAARLDDPNTPEPHRGECIILAKMTIN